MASSDIETFLLDYLDEQGTLPMEELTRHCDRFTSNQVFFAVDHLSREGKILL